MVLPQNPETYLGCMAIPENPETQEVDVTLRGSPNVVAVQRVLLGNVFRVRYYTPKPSKHDVTPRRCSMGPAQTGIAHALRPNGTVAVDCHFCGCASGQFNPGTYMML